MNEGTDSTLNIEAETIETSYNSGLGELIDDIIRDQDLLTFKDKTRIPIPTESLEEGSITLEIGPNVQEISKSYIKLINSSQTALEYPLLITGSQSPSNEIDSFSPLYDNTEGLKNDELKMSSYSKMLYNAVLKSKDEKRDILILGHTHPKPTQETKNLSLLNKISSDLKEKHKVKELGLNLSLQDLHQLIYFQSAIDGVSNPDTKAMISVIMFNGNITYVYIEDGKFKTAKTIQKKGGTTAPPSS